VIFIQHVIKQKIRKLKTGVGEEIKKSTAKCSKKKRSRRCPEWLAIVESCFSQKSWVIGLIEMIMLRLQN